MMGNSDVGKTALTECYLDNRINDQPRHSRYNELTVLSSNDGEDCIMYIKSVEVLNVILWSAIILVFSVNDIQSYNDIRTKWFPKIKERGPTAPIILVGNKTNLREKGNETITTKMSMQLPLRSTP